jgi:hypothetical protein
MSGGFAKYFGSELLAVSQKIGRQVQIIHDEIESMTRAS